jgi:hypothetical protein
LTWFSFIATAQAQDVFNVIKKAQAKFERGNSKKALKHLRKAETMDYGFCGNVWLEANHDINVLRFKIYYKQKEYLLARNSLDSIRLVYENERFDSLRIRTYQLEFGKAVFNTMLNAALVNARYHFENYEGYVIIPIANGTDVRLKLDQNFLTTLFRKEKQQEDITVWVEEFKTSKNYKLINL